MLHIFLVFALHSTFCFGGLPRSTNTVWNQWEIQWLTLFRSKIPYQPNFSAGFKLFRSYNYPCLSGNNTPVNFQLEDPCGWVVPDNPISCSNVTSIIIPKEETLPLWSSCDSYPRGVEGEREASEESKKWLKWRVHDFKERKTNNDTTQAQNLLKNVPFESTTVEIVNGIPLKQYVIR
jgi:hypothetical protein